MNRFAVSIVLVLGVLFGTFVFVGGIFWYVDVPSLVLVVAFPVLFLAESFSFREMGSIFLLAFSEEAPVPRLREGILFFGLLRRYFVLSGLLMTLVGIVAIFTNSAEPIIIGQGLAVAILTLLYSIVLSCVTALPLKARLERKLIAAEAAVPDSGTV
jgi:flagellar motor component MotA